MNLNTQKTQSYTVRKYHISQVELTETAWLEVTVTKLEVDLVK